MYPLGKAETAPPMCLFYNTVSDEFELIEGGTDIIHSKPEDIARDGDRVRKQRLVPEEYWDRDKDIREGDDEV